MRLPVVPQISTKDGISNKNARLTNALKETNKQGDKAVIRPGLTLDAVASGVGNGLVVFNDALVSVYGATVGEKLNDAVIGSWLATPEIDTDIVIPAIAYMNGVYVAVGSDVNTGAGRIYSSVDASSWTLRLTGADGESFTSVAAGNGRFVAFKAVGQITSKFATSTDGATWSLSDAPDIGGGLGNIVFDGTYFIMVTGHSYNYRSANGVTWTPISNCYIGGSGTIGTQVYADPVTRRVFAVVEDDPGDYWATVTNNHGTSWSVSNLTSPSTALRVCAGNGIAIATTVPSATEIEIHLSNDGITYNSVAVIDVGDSSQFDGSGRLAFANGVFCITYGGGIYGSPLGLYYTSVDGIEWTSYTPFIDTTEFSFVSINPTPAGFIATSYESKVATITAMGAVTTIGTVSGDHFDFAQSPL